MTEPIFKSIQIVRAAGNLLIISGLIHIIVWLTLGGSWEGPVSWRKPILFGLSTGATLISIAWLFPKLKTRRWDAVVCWTLALTLIAEVALITVQQWRGQPSHFNHQTELDSAIEYWMTGLIVVATLILIQVTWRTFFDLRAPTDQQLAIRAGMVFLLVSCLIGFVVLINGQMQIDNRLDPTVYGKAGVAKFPHGVAIHAIQIFPILAVVLQKLGLNRSNRVRMLGYSIAAMSSVLTYSLVQTALGKSRFEVTIPGGFFLMLTIILMLPVLREVAMAWRSLITRRPQHSRM